MQVEWFGHSAFALTGAEAKVFIDPFADLSRAKERGLRFDYPTIEVEGVDLLLVTHEHFDHNGVEAIGGEPEVLRAGAGRLASPIGEVLAIASEHDGAAGTERGPNTIFAFDLDGLRVAHFGDFGQRELRPEQAALLEGLDLMFLPVGGGPTIDAAAAAAIVEALEPRWVVPMHYRTPRVDFLEPADQFVALVGRVERPPESRFEALDLPDGEGPLVVVPPAP